MKGRDRPRRADARYEYQSPMWVARQGLSFKRAIVNVKKAGGYEHYCSISRGIRKFRYALLTCFAEWTRPHISLCSGFEMLDVVGKMAWPITLAPWGDIGSESLSSEPIGIESESLRLRNSLFKRLTDIGGAGLGLLILLPFLALVALMIVLDSKGPVIFRQRRSGLNGKIFTIYKFRTMNVMEDGADVIQATRVDNRVTWIGKFLRCSSIDELPQLMNVLKGEMSLVGPRPHAVAHDQYYVQTVPSYHLRFHAKPGITGLAQITGFRGEVRDIRHMEGRVACDLKYIRNWSLLMDARILFITVLGAPFHRCAY